MNKFRVLIYILFLLLMETAYSNENLATFIIRDYNSNELPYVGSSNADVTIVEFFDYRCGYCSKQAVDLAKLLEEKDNVKIIYMEFPIFGGISEIAAEIALNVWNQNPSLYFDVHNGLMQLGPSMKKNTIINLLNNLNLEGDLIFSQAEGQKENKTIMKNKSLAKRLNLRGTPALIINDNLSPGYVKYENLITFIE